VSDPVVTDPVVSEAAALRRLRDARGFIVGLDGTLALGDPGGDTLKALPGAVELLGELWQRDCPYQVFSNRTDRTPAQFAAAARDAGLEVPDARMMTPAMSAVVVCRRRGWQRVMVLGTAGLIEPLRAYRVQVVTPDEELSGADELLGLLRATG
jgi:NagD protein